MVGSSLGDQHKARWWVLSYKRHAAVCTSTGLPVAWRVETAKAHASSLADELLQRVRARVRPQTAALDKGYEFGPVYEACALGPLRSPRFVRPQPSSAATIWLPSASTAAGRSRVRTPSAVQVSGAVRRANALPSHDGSRRLGCILSFRARLSGGGTSIDVVRLSSASSAASSTSTVCSRSGSAALSAPSFTPTSPCLPGSRRRSPERELFHRRVERRSPQTRQSMGQREPGECIGGGGAPMRQTEQLEMDGSTTGGCPVCAQRLRLDRTTV